MSDNKSQPAMKSQQPLETPGSGKSEVAELRDLITAQQAQIEDLKKMVSGQQAVPVAQVAQPYAPLQPYFDPAEERQRHMIEKAARKSAKASQTKAEKERALVDGEVKYFLQSDGEPMMGRCVGARSLGNPHDEMAICRAKYMTYFGMTNTTKEIKAEPWTEAHWERIPAHVRESIRLEAAAA